ncbi:hypothetical protein KBA73_05680 [Patescibacteria group bacterium]|nr:hypothetical protein [Patescibacteria group bacterium]
MFCSFHLGDFRAVIALPTLGFVVKLPRVQLYNLGRLVHDEFTRHTFRIGLQRLIKSYLKRDIETHWSPKRFLYKGLVDNWREWRFSQTFDHPLLAKTYFWIGGMTIQAYAAPLPFEVENTYEGIMDFARRFTPIIGTRIMRDAHHFQNPLNFGVINGHLVIVDYASEKVQSILQECADDLLRDFPLT